MEGLDEEQTTAVSALHESIRKKGSSSYYYAHGHGANGPEWDGKEQPRLLAKSVNTPPPDVRKIRGIESYSWMDGKKSVKVLVDYDNAIGVDDECLALDWTNTSINFRMTVDDCEYGLNLCPLHGAIDSAAIKKKANKFIITLRKKSDAPWYQLTNKGT